MRLGKELRTEPDLLPGEEPDKDLRSLLAT